MVVARRRGTTLIELLTVMTIFSVLMSLILGFYIYAYRVSGSRDRLSAAYRKMITIMDKVETLLANSKVIYENTSEVVFCPMNATQPLLKGGWPNWSPPTTLLVTPASKTANSGYQLLARTSDSKTSVVGLVGPGEAIAFGSASTTGVFSSQPDSVSLSVTVQVLPERGVGIPRHYTLSRTILLERP
jgi:prepilin-type N-terminal cleavage/methylation domain-containing protein